MVLYRVRTIASMVSLMGLFAHGPAAATALGSGSAQFDLASLTSSGDITAAPYISYPPFQVNQFIPVPPPSPSGIELFISSYARNADSWYGNSWWGGNNSTATSTVDHAIAVSDI